MSRRRAIARAPFKGKLERHARIAFGQAGAIYLGPDATLLEGCAAILEAYESLLADGGHPSRYVRAARRIEARAESIAGLRAATTDGLRAKTQVVLALDSIGMGCSAGRMMAESLARDMAVGGD